MYRRHPASTRPRVPQFIIQNLRRALQTAKLETHKDKTAIDAQRAAGEFGAIGEGPTPAGIALYLDSWCVPKIRGVLAWAEGEECVEDENGIWAKEDA